MMDVSRERILEALNIIKEVCEKTEDCSDCLLWDWNYDGCMLVTQHPHTWELVSDTTPWRAFKD